MKSDKKVNQKPTETNFVHQWFLRGVTLDPLRITKITGMVVAFFVISFFSPALMIDICRATHYIKPHERKRYFKTHLSR
jgi:hypothetical protein